MFPESTIDVEVGVERVSDSNIVHVDVDDVALRALEEGKRQGAGPL
jgi:hypothetical protein